jgi:hypothetical protein
MVKLRVGLGRREGGRERGGFHIPSAFVASAMRGMSRSHDRHSSIKHPCSSILENLCCSSTQKSSSLLLPAAQKFLRKTQNPQKFKKNLSPKEA